MDKFEDGSMQSEILTELRDQRTILIDLVGRVSGVEVAVKSITGNGHPGRLTTLETSLNTLRDKVNDLDLTRADWKGRLAMLAGFGSLLMWALPHVLKLLGWMK